LLTYSDGLVSGEIEKALGIVPYKGDGATRFATVSPISARELSEAARVTTERPNLIYLTKRSKGRAFQIIGVSGKPTSR
jgi:hypothetical protein